MIYSLLGFYLNWRAYNVFGEGHPRRWEVTLKSGYLLMRSKRMRYKMPAVSCFPCDISAWKFMLASGGRGRLQGKHWSSHHCQYDVTFRLNEIQNGAQSGIRRDVRKCRVFVGKTDSFTVIGNGEISTIFS